MRHSEPAPVSEIMVRYSAAELPTEAIVGLQHDVMRSHERRERTTTETLRIINLLLTITLQKLTATP